MCLLAGLSLRGGELLYSNPLCRLTTRQTGLMLYTLVTCGSRVEYASCAPSEMSTPSSWSMLASMTPSRIALAAIDSMSCGRGEGGVKGWVEIDSIS